MEVIRLTCLWPNLARGVRSFLLDRHTSQLSDLFRGLSTLRLALCKINPA
jgi:hypothetical protein